MCILPLGPVVRMSMSMSMTPCPTHVWSHTTQSTCKHYTSGFVKLLIHLIVGIGYGVQIDAFLPVTTSMYRDPFNMTL